MHGHGSQAGTPASDAAGRGDAGRTPQTAHLCRVVPRGKSWIGPTRADAAEIDVDSMEIGADAAQIEPTRSVSACIGRNDRVRPKFKKKKKGAKRTVWLNLNTQTPSDPHTSSKTLKHPLSLHPSSPFSMCSVPHLSSLCSELSVSAVCTLHCFSLQVCSLYSLLEFLFFVFYNFSLSNCLEMNLWIWKFMCLTACCVFFSCFFNSCGS